MTALELGIITKYMETTQDNLGELYLVATRGQHVDPILVSAIKQFAQNSNDRHFDSTNIPELNGFISKVTLDPDEKARVTDYYGILRGKGSFPVPQGQEASAQVIKGLGDQKKFAFALLLSGNREEFDGFIHKYPLMFGLKDEKVLVGSR